MSEASNSNGHIIRCPGCQQKLSVTPEMIGKLFRCAKCGKNLQVKPPVHPNPLPNVPPLNLPALSSIATSTEKSASNVSYPSGQPNTSDFRKIVGAKPSLTHLLLLAFLILFSAAMVAGAIYSWRVVLDRDKEVQEARQIASNVEKSHSSIKNPVNGNGQKADGDKGLPNPAAPAITFPRRALLIAINEYLYANPVQQGYANSWKGLDKLGRALQVGWRFPANQIAQLSDAIQGGPVPLKKNVEKTVEDFCSSCRKQDQALVWFTGHATMVGDKAYLAPLDGDLIQESTLIPLDWVFEKLKASPARQKVLVLDVFRFNPVIGHERPGSDPLPEAFEKIALTPPPGVEVVLACGKDQNSYETEEEPMGVLPFAISEVLNSQLTRDLTPDDPLPVADLVEKVNQGVLKGVKAPIRPLSERLESTKRDGKPAIMKVSAAGKPSADGAKYDEAEPPPPSPVLARTQVENKAGRDLNAQVLKELALPPIRRGRAETGLHLETLPVMTVEEASKYRDNPVAETPLNKAMKQAQINLWAISGMDPPPDLKNLVMDVRRQKKVNLEAMVDFYTKPVDDARFKASIETNQKDMAKVFAMVEGDYETLKELGEDVGNEPKRLQGHYLFLKARLEAQIANLYEYQSALGSMRKELPAIEKGHSGWRLASTIKLRGDRAGKQAEKDQKADLKKLIDKFPASPWAVLARRDMLTSLGLEWQSAAKKD